MHIYFSLLIFLVGVSNGAQKNEGLILQQKTHTAVLPYGNNIIIYRIDNKQSIEGELVNVSQEEIYIKDITSTN